MDALAKIFRIVFVDHYVELLILAISWVPIYFGQQLVEYIARKILLGLPYQFRIKRKRRELNLPELRDNIAKGEWQLVSQFAEQDAKLVAKVGEAISNFDRELSAINKGAHWVARALRDRSVHLEVRNIAHKSLIDLETDSFICAAIVGKEEKSKNGIIHLADIQSIKVSETVGVLFYTMLFGSESARNAASFHIARKIKNSEQQEELEKIISTWPSPVQEKAIKATNEIKHQLQIRDMSAA